MSEENNMNNFFEGWKIETHTCGAMNTFCSTFDLFIGDLNSSFIFNAMLHIGKQIHTRSSLRIIKLYHIWKVAIYSLLHVMWTSFLNRTHAESPEHSILLHEQSLTNHSKFHRFYWRFHFRHLNELIYSGIWWMEKLNYNESKWLLQKDGR